MTLNSVLTDKTLWYSEIALYITNTVKYGSNEHAFNENLTVKKKILSPHSIFFFISMLAVKKFACNKQIWMSLQFR